jgi:DNA-binding beta-propeller fold protein YncE
MNLVRIVRPGCCPDERPLPPSRAERRIWVRPCSRLRLRHAPAGLLLAGTLGCFTSGEPAREAVAGTDAIVIEGVGFDRPVSVLHDPVGDVYLVANAPATGAPFIARVAPRGRVLALRWIDGGVAAGAELGAAGGMALRDDTLYVTDRGCLRRFHRVTGVAAAAICPASAVALNAVAVDARGNVYAADALSGTVYRIDGPAGTRVARDAVFEGSEGLAAGASGLFIASGGLYQLAPDGPRTVIRDAGDRLGGIVFTADGSFAFSKRTDSTVLYVQARAGESRAAVWTLMREVPAAGLLGYDAHRERILIPLVDADRLVIVSLKP